MKEISITSVQHFMNYIEQYKGNYYFRGQANYKWGVEPNIFRDEMKLRNEQDEINQHYDGNNLEIFNKILFMQHYGNGTRMCDVTINPLVALYFAIEDEREDDNPCSVFIFDKSYKISINSVEMQIMLLLTTEDITTLAQLKICCEKYNIVMSESELAMIIQKNYLITYNINIAYSNIRAMLQGGTGLFFGFSIAGDTIKRKGNANISSMVARINIGKELKPVIRDFLKKFGICKSVLYDVSSNNTDLSYKDDSKMDDRGFIKKIFLDIEVSDVAFEESDIYKIVKATIAKTKKMYNDISLIYTYVYYDIQDKRASNWIAMPKLSDNKDGFILNFNKKYYQRRMTYINNEVSINIIVELTEPIILACKSALSNIEKIHNAYFLKNITALELKKSLIEIRKEIYKMVLFDLQNIEHGEKQFDEYYKASDIFCCKVDSFLEKQIQYLTDNQNDKFLKYSFDNEFKQCNESYILYQKTIPF